MTQVLVVDDSLSVRKALETILRPLAFTVRMAESGEAALTALAQQEADLVIADVLMPGLSGFELCQQIKASVRHSGTPVLLISGIVSEQEKAQASGVGAYGLVKKPFRADDLIPVVKAALQSGKAAGQPKIEVAAAVPGRPDVGELLDTLLGKQGILSAVVLATDGSTVSQRGAELPNADTLTRYLAFFANAASVYGRHLNDDWNSILIEYGERAVLLSPLNARHVLAVVLRDAGAATVAKFVVKGQRGNFELALQPA